MSEEKLKIADDVMKTLEKKLNEIKDMTEGWGKTIACVFTDIQTGYLMKFAMDGTATIERKPASEIKEGDVEAVTYLVDVLDFKNVVEGNVNPMGLMGSGKMKLVGNQSAFMKIAPALM